MKEQQYKALLKVAECGDIIYLGSNTFTSKLVKAGQSIEDKTWTKNLTHIVAVNRDFKVVESTIGIENGHYCNGIEIRKFQDWRPKEDEKWVVIQRINGLTNSQLDIITADAQRLKDKGIKYPVGELVGTMLKYLKHLVFGEKILKEKNIFDTSGMYCIAFINHIFEKAGIRLIPKEVSESCSNVGHGLRNIDLDYDLIFISPSGQPTFVKTKGMPFCLKI